jgi:hypothetical protein
MGENVAERRTFGDCHLIFEIIGHADIGTAIYRLIYDWLWVGLHLALFITRYEYGKPMPTGRVCGGV